jgi:hypothetical protein
MNVYCSSSCNVREHSRQGRCISLYQRMNTLTRGGVRRYMLVTPTVSTIALYVDVDYHCTQARHACVEGRAWWLHGMRQPRNSVRAGTLLVRLNTLVIQNRSYCLSDVAWATQYTLEKRVGVERGEDRRVRFRMGCQARQRRWEPMQLQRIPQNNDCAQSRYRRQAL